MSDHDPFDHGAFLREIEWWNTSVKHGGGKLEPISPSWTPAASKTTTGRCRRSTPDRKPLDVDLMLVGAAMIMCAICQLGLFCEWFEVANPNRYMVIGSVLSAMGYGRILNRCRRKMPHGVIASTIHGCWYLFMLSAPIIITLYIMNNR